MSDKKNTLPSWINRQSVLSLASATANVGLWIQAGQLVEGNNPVGLISSAALGVAMSYGLLEIMSRAAGLDPVLTKTVKTIERHRPNPRFWLPVVSAGFVLVAEAGLLGAVVVALGRGVTLSSLLGEWLWLWGPGRVLASGFVLMGLAVSGKAQKPAQATAEKPQAVVVVPQPTAQPAEIIAEKPYKCEPCGASYETQREYAGHCGGKSHKSRVAPLGYQVEFKAITKEVTK
jgi:hypothetical protein